MNATACYFVNTMESSDSEIARGLRRRDTDLLDRLIEEYQHRLLRYLIHLCGNHELAEDLFQETWIRVLERGRQFNSKHKFSTWLYTVARNLTIDHFRKKMPLSLDGLMESGRSGQDVRPSSSSSSALEPPDTKPMAWELVQRHQQADRINAALARLPAEYREAIVLRFQDELALEEIAVVSGAPLGTVKSRLYRGLTLLTAELEGTQA